MIYKIFTTVLMFAISGTTTSCFGQRSSTSTLLHSFAEGRLIEISGLKRARADHSATLLQSGKVLIAGGMEKNGVFYDTAEMFDPTSNTTRELRSKMIKNRVSHSATLLADGRVLFVGGWSGRNTYEKTAEIFDPVTETFSSAGNMSFRRAAHSDTLLKDGTVLIAGGLSEGRKLIEAEIFDPKTNTFLTANKMNSVRAGHIAVRLDNDNVLIVGGSADRNTILSSAEVFDVNSGQFRPVKANMIDGRHKHDAIKLSDGRVLIFGGSNENDWGGRFTSAEIFDPETERFIASGNMHYPRFKIGGSSVLLSSGKVLIGGGNEQAEIFDPATGLFLKVEGVFGMPLHFASVTLLKDGRALIAGGYGRGTAADGPVSTNRSWIFQM